MNVNDENKMSKTGIFMIITCFMTNISQVPAIVKGGITGLICIPFWIIALIIIIFKNKYKFKKQNIILIIITILFFIGQGIATIIKGNNYFITSLSYPFYLSMYIFFIGYFLSDNIVHRDIKGIIFSYIISVNIISYISYSESFKGTYKWDAIQYAYGSKNSISQVIFTAIVLLIFCYRPKKSINKVVKILNIILLLTFLLALKSRATIIGLFIIPIVTIFFSRFKRKRKVIILLSIIILGVLLIKNQEISNFVINNVLFGNRDISNLNDVSSGRIEMMKSFPYLIKGNEFFGVGNNYFENFYLAAFLQHGFIFGTLLILIAIYPVIWALRNLSMNNEINIMFLIIALSYCVNAIFEGIAPFGPGVKCYFLWLFFGITVNKSKILNALE